MKQVSRRDFLKYGLGGTAAIAVGVTGFKMLWMLKKYRTYAQVPTVQTLNFTITDAVKEMVTHQDPRLNRTANIAECFFWIYKADVPNLPPEVPGPIIIAFEGDTIPITATNALDEPHSLAIPGIGFNTGPIPENGGTFTGTITVPAVSAGTYLYFDDLNPPVNRVMGLHGAFIVLPTAAVPGRRFTPYNPAVVPDNVQQLFDDLGHPNAHFPGLAWEEAGVNPVPFPDTPAFRQYVWVLHEASPRLFTEVGNFPAGRNFPAADFVEAFLNDPFAPPQGENQPPAIPNRLPEFFTISGQSGHHAHSSPFITPHLRVGEPCVVRVLNAGLWVHTLHIHANHVYVLRVSHQGGGANAVFEAVPGQVDNPILVDTFEANPLDVWDCLVPYTRPPDVPNERGIGLADAPLPVAFPDPLRGFGTGEGRRTPEAITTWPPVQELNLHIPKQGTSAGKIPFDGHLAPLCYPMHDHSEPTQTAQGGNYTMGMMSGMNFSGDRNIDPAAVVTFNHAPTVFGPEGTTRAIVPASGPEPPFPELEV